MTPTDARERFATAASAPSPDPRARRPPRWSIPPRTALLALAVIAAVVAVGWMWSASAQPAVPVPVAEPRATPTLEPTAAADDVPLLVHVVGQVAAPGLVELPTGSRVADALDAAGGALPHADLTALNLAAPVQDGAQVRVPAPGEQAPVTAEGSDATGLIDVNRASASELEQLPGVGPVLAARIVADREENGPFGSVDDLERVSGIGPSVLATLRDQATT